MRIKYINKIPTVDEFNDLSESVGFERRDDKIVKESLKNTLYSVCVYANEELIGYGRIIGDGAIYLYIQNVMVYPKYQKHKIGAGIMNVLLKKVEDFKKINSNIKTYLFTVKGKEGFYEQFGFVARPNDDMGSGMILKS